MPDNELQYKVSVESEELRRLRDELDQLKKKAKDSAESVGVQWSKAGKNISDVGDKLTKGLTLPLAGAAGLAIKTSIDFETAFAGVRKTVGATEEEFAVLRDSIIDMAEELPATREEIAAVVEAAGQLGIEKSSLMDFTRVMIDLGESTNLSADGAATALARLANITAMPQENFDRLGSTVVELGNRLATTESEIVEMSLRLAGAGEQVGLTEDQILGVAAALSSVGIEAEAGGSATSKVLVELALAAASGGEQLELFAEVAGTSAEDFRKSFEDDAAGAFTEFVAGLRRISDEGGNVFLVLEEMGITEVRMRDALLRLAGSEDILNQSLQIGAEAWSENTALADEAAKRYATTGSQLEMLKNRATGVALTFGDAMVPALMDALEAAEPLLEAVGGLAQRFADLDPATQRAIIQALAMAAALGPVLSVTGRLTTGVADLVGGYISLQGQMKAGVGAAQALSGANGAMAAGYLAAAFAVGYMTGELINQIPAVRETAEELGNLAGEVDSLTAYIEQANKNRPWWSYTGAAGAAVYGAQALGGALGYVSGSSKKPMGNAAGTIQTEPTLGWTGEDGTEAIINLTNPAYRDRSLALYDIAGQALGVSGGIVVNIGAINAPGGDASQVRAAAQAGALAGVSAAIQRQRGHSGLIGYTN